MPDSIETTDTLYHSQPRGVHLVGSVPLSNAEEVFRTASAILGGRLRRLPDGETGERTNWFGWQIQVFAAHPFFEVLPQESRAYTSRPAITLRSPTPAGELVFDHLGYADVALASYAVFSRLKQEGVIPARCRFQVSLPTPLAPVVRFVGLENLALVEPAYEAAMFAELERITAAIPHTELAIQWDVAVEFALLEGEAFVGSRQEQQGIVERLIRIGERVPADVELGYHLCYGDAGHKHFKEPEDSSLLVEVANAISAGVTRAINWIHLPVPRNRTDEAYFAPLRTLRLHPETERYLGLVHYTDGVEGTRQRIAAAQGAVKNFGVATECGMGRRKAETIPDLLRIHREVALLVEG